MELEQFIEEDIRAFLDRVIEERKTAPGRPDAARTETVLTPEEMTLYAPARDYGRELEVSLAEKDVPKAKRVLNDLKALFDESVPQTPERAERRALFESLYRRFQQAVAGNAQLQEADLVSDLQRFATPRAPTIASTAPWSRTSPTVAAAQPAEKPGNEKSSATPKRPADRMSDTEARALEADLAQLETLVAERKPVAAMQTYHLIRKGLAIERLDGAQRERVIGRMRDAYERIVAAATDERRRQGPPPEDAARRYDEHHHSARMALTAGDVAEAMRHYNALHGLVAVLPAHKQARAREELPLLREELQRRIAATEPGTMLDHEERRLVGRP